jgi:spore germination cell wall hydrolase CwlJ-like protein
MDLNDPRDVLARTIWGEARSTGKAGMTHVASVVLNRVARAGWWGMDVITVCLKAYQFSCWNVGDPNRAKLEAVTVADGEFRIASAIAWSAINGQLPDATGGADSFFALTLTPWPKWTIGATHTFSDGWHTFWRTKQPQDAVPVSGAPVA